MSTTISQTPVLRFYWLVTAFVPPSLLLAGISVVSVLVRGTGNSLGNLTVFWTLFNGPVTIALGLWIMRRVRGNVVGPLLVLWGVQNCVWSSQGLTLQSIAATFTLAVGIVSGFYLLIYFPNGKPFPARAARWYSIVYCVMVLGGILFILSHPTFVTVAARIRTTHLLCVVALAPLQGVSKLVYTLSLAGWLWGPLTLILRYRGSSLREKTQIKWLAYYALLMIPAAVTILIGNSLFDDSPPSLYRIYLGVIYTFFQLAPAIFIGIAILRYRLWDIDVIIRKTLVYAVLTGLLALVYFGSVILLQQLFGALTGVEQSPLAVVISTLTIAALFSPLRRLLQDAIDRRFYRKKYDAQQVLAQFAVTARDETDLDGLTAELVRVVQETLQPEQVSVWLRNK